jgi:hypothetical protein
LEPLLRRCSDSLRVLMLFGILATWSTGGCSAPSHSMGRSATAARTALEPRIYPQASPYFGRLRGPVFEMCG